MTSPRAWMNLTQACVVPLAAGWMGCAAAPPRSPGAGTLLCAPSWAGEVRVLRGTFGATVVACRASDGRHVVLGRSPLWTHILREEVRSGGRIVYTSPKGFRAWAGGPEKWYSATVLRSAQHVIEAPPAEDRCGYVIESPTGRFAILAVNGPVSRDELVALVNGMTLSADPPGASPR